MREDANQIRKSDQLRTVMINLLDEAHIRNSIESIAYLVRRIIRVGRANNDS